jgi:hypothetical protein
MNAPRSERRLDIREGFSLAKEGEINRRGEVATVVASESSQLYERLLMVTMPGSAAPSRETSIGTTVRMY